MPIWKCCPSFIGSSGAYRPKYQKSTLLACLAQRQSAFTSRCGTDTPGRGALEPPAEDGARTKLFDREFQFRESHTEAETKKKLLTKSPKKKMIIYIYIFIFHVVIEYTRKLGQRHTLLCFFNNFTPVTSLGVSHGYTSYG